MFDLISLRCVQVWHPGDVPLCDGFHPEVLRQAGLRAVRAGEHLWRPREQSVPVPWPPHPPLHRLQTQASAQDLHEEASPRCGALTGHYVCLRCVVVKIIVCARTVCVGF